MSTDTVVQTSPTVTMDVPIIPTPPPIVHVWWATLSFLSAASSALAFLLSKTWTVVKTSLAPLRFVVSGLSTPLLYILSPVLVLANILAQLFIIGPYNLAAAFLRAIYPIYVFVGVACIVAAVVGLCARGAVYILHAFIFPDPVESELGPGEKAVSAIKTEDTQPRTRKKVSIKEEADVL